MQRTVLVLFLALFSVCAEDPPEADVHDHDLSDEQHYGTEGEHNPQYDHEAFVGRDGAAEFEDLTPDESKQKLRKLVVKIDSDKDGFVTLDEMKEWIAKQLRRYIYHDVEGQFSSNDLDGDKQVSWEEYKNTTYAYIDESDVSDDPNMKQMINRDKKRFDMADVSKDGKLDTEEYVYFIHPEESKHMGSIIIDETLEDLDKDGDGALSLEEYLGEPGTDPDTGEPPEWVKSETETFKTVRDSNGNGKMDRSEIEEWIMPGSNTHVEDESKHLIEQADTDQDGKLTPDEIVSHYDLFVGSQATDYGSLLQNHDEL